MRALFLIALSTLLAACGGPQVKTDYDPAIAWSDMTGYHWLGGDADPLFDRRITDAVTNQMAAQGYRAVAKAEADFLLRYQWQVAEKLKSSPFSFGIGTGTSVGSGGVGVGVSTGGGVREVSEGTLILDVLDPASERLLWRGSLAQTLPADSTPGEREQRIQQAVGEILSQFPPQA